METTGENSNVAFDRALARFLFFAAETLTVIGWIIFTGPFDVYYRGHMVEPFRTIEPFVIAAFFGLPVISFWLRRSDRRLAMIGFATFVGGWAVIGVCQLL